MLEITHLYSSDRYSVCFFLYKFHGRASNIERGKCIPYILKWATNRLLVSSKWPSGSSLSNFLHIRCQLRLPSSLQYSPDHLCHCVTVILSHDARIGEQLRAGHRYFVCHDLVLWNGLAP